MAAPFCDCEKDYERIPRDDDDSVNWRSVLKLAFALAVIGFIVQGAFTSALLPFLAAFASYIGYVIVDSDSGCHHD